MKLWVHFYEMPLSVLHPFVIFLFSDFLVQLQTLKRARFSSLSLSLFRPFVIILSSILSLRGAKAFSMIKADDEESSR